jgi:hypothetical protein
MGGVDEHHASDAFGILPVKHSDIEPAECVSNQQVRSLFANVQERF